MGSMTRMARCGRFIDQTGATLRKRYQKYDYQKGDWWELINFDLGQSDDGTEVVKLYLTFRNKRTGDEHVFCHDSAIFEPEGQDHDNVALLACELSENGVDSENYQKNVKTAVKLLKKADLIQPNYSAEEEVA